MIKSSRKSFYVLICASIIFLFISIACGSSTAQQLASAVPTAVVQNQVTNEIKPTDQQTIKQQPTEPRPTVKPENTQPIASSPTPEPEAIELIAQGMGQNGQELGYGFIVNNPNPNYAYENSEYQVAIYDAEGIVVETDSGYLNLILPSQELGVGGTLYLDEGISASKINVQINAGQATVSELSTTFTTDKVTYFPDEYFPEVRGVITNPYNKSITDIRTSVLLFNEADEIIGGGFTYVNFVNANSSAGVSTSVTSNGDIKKVEMYPSVSWLSDLDTAEQLPSGTENINISKQGYGQNGSTLGIGMIVVNPNQGFTVEGTMYHATAYAEDNSVLGVSEGYIELLLPGQTLGLADEMYLDEGVTVTSLVIQIKQGDYSTSDPISIFTYENAAYLPDEYFPQITGEILSPYAKDITNLRVSALAYNESGDIIGGGYTYVDFVPANSKSAVSIDTTVSETPATVELFTSVTALSDIED